MAGLLASDYDELSSVTAHTEFSVGKSDTGAGFCMNTWVFLC